MKIEKIVTIVFLCVLGLYVPSVVKADILKISTETFNGVNISYIENMHSPNSTGKIFIAVVKFVVEYVGGKVCDYLVRIIGDSVEDCVENAKEYNEMIKYNYLVLSSTMSIERIYEVSHITMSLPNKSLND